MHGQHIIILVSGIVTSLTLGPYCLSEFIFLSVTHYSSISILYMPDATVYYTIGTTTTRPPTQSSSSSFLLYFHFVWLKLFTAHVVFQAGRTKQQFGGLTATTKHNIITTVVSFFHVYSFVPMTGEIGTFFMFINYIF